MSRAGSRRGSARPMSRREAVLRLTGALAALGMAGCVPARIVLHLYPDMYHHDDALCRRVFAAFTRTVVPSASADDPNLTRAYVDPAFPLARYRGYFASDLCQRAMRVGGVRTFDRLDAKRRHAVVAAAAADRGMTGRLYRGAIYLTQIALYAGIYDDDRRGARRRLGILRGGLATGTVGRVPSGGSERIAALADERPGSGDARSVVRAGRAHAAPRADRTRARPEERPGLRAHEDAARVQL